MIMPPDTRGGPEGPKSALLLRRARPTDATALAALSSQLTSPSSEDALGDRLAQLTRSQTGRVYVAEHEGEVVGWIQVMRLELLVSDVGAAIVGLVVDNERRHLGIGKRLVARAERWCREQGCRIVIVRSRSHREGAHRFYERLGYEHHKTQVAFRKELAPLRSGNEIDVETRKIDSDPAIETLPASEPEGGPPTRTLHQPGAEVTFDDVEDTITD